MLGLGEHIEGGDGGYGVATRHWLGHICRVFDDLGAVLNEGAAQKA